MVFVAINRRCNVQRNYMGVVELAYGASPLSFERDILVRRIL